MAETSFHTSLYFIEKFVCLIVFFPVCVFVVQESVTDYTIPSSSLADNVPTAGTKMEESLVTPVSASVLKSIFVCVWSFSVYLTLSRLLV